MSWLRIGTGGILRASPSEIKAFPNYGSEKIKIFPL